jgi:NAD(P)-dependent dehydrogenase (short-subunit alcohol dehydrogenase family)
MTHVPDANRTVVIIHNTAAKGGSAVDDDLRLDGNVAIVTGGASGIGLAVARDLHRHGVHIAVADINRRSAAEVASGLTKTGKKSAAFAVDVAQSTEAADCINATVAEFGHLDIVVNCAGVNFLVEPDVMTDAQWRQVLAVNLDGTFFMIRAAIPHLKASGGGKIVNISSGAGLSGVPQAAHYAAAKHGVIGLTRALAVDLGPYNINVNAICPGTTLTPMVQQTLSDARLRHETLRYPMGRLGRPEDIARAVVFLASSASDWITGIALPVDGGLLACIRANNRVPVESERD